MIINIYTAWIGILFGCLVGAIPGLFFHKSDWLGGYASWRRRMIRLAHIAFLGIGLINLLEELLQLGLTLPGFVERSKTIASLPSLGLLTLAGMTPARHSVKYVEVPDVQRLDTLPKDIDLAAVSSYSAQIDEAYSLAGHYRALGVPTVIGGPHVTALPKEAAQYCDTVCRKPDA